MATNLKVRRSTVSGSANNQAMNMGMLLGIVFAVMIILQLIGFSGFKDWLTAIGFTSASSWAVIIIIVEVLGALSFFKLALPPIAKMVSWAAALVTGLFWFVENIRLVSDGTGTQLTSSGFFGKYLQQSPGWWTVIEVSIFLFWILYSLGFEKD